MRSTGWSPSLPLPPPASSPAATLAVAPASAQPRPPAQAARSPARAARSPARAALSLALSPVLAACLAAPPEQPVLEVRVAVPVPCIRTGVCLAGTLRLEQADGGQPCLFEDVPHHEPAGETTCDGLDNDCDGETDEGLRPGEGLGCGGATPGICREITPTCQGREGWQCLFPPDHEPGGETLCDGKDNDCDGATDEDLDGEAPFPCLDEHGEEARCPGGVLPAQRVCRAGRWECRYPDAEPCRLAGVCQGRGSGLAACRDGVWDCILDGPGPQMELGEEASCDLLDNDCDGRVDEGRCTHCRAFSSRDCTAANQVRSCDSSGGPDAAPAISCPDGGICLGPGTCGVQLEPELAQGETVVQGRVALAARAGWAPRGGTAEHALAALAVRSPGGAGSRILWQELDEQGQIVAEGRLGEAAADPVLAILPSAEAQAPCALLGWREQAAERAQLWVGRVGRGCPAGGGEPLLLAQGAMLGSPSLAADEQGHLAAAWTEGEAGSDSVRAVVWAENEERSLPEPREH
ncbi:MAG: hypothetical protein FJ125_01140, partial [Deltaproteobacteria bacterium]|nr:hypothetical protein [Deltaproteobacteria bacterium]